jgi:hypothetical protein
MHIHDIRQGKIDPKLLLPHTIDQKLLEIFAQQLKKIMSAEHAENNRYEF